MKTKLLTVLLSFSLLACSSKTVPPPPGLVTNEEFQKVNAQVIFAINAITAYIGELQARGMLPIPEEKGK